MADTKEAVKGPQSYLKTFYRRLTLAEQDHFLGKPPVQLKLKSIRNSSKSDKDLALLKFAAIFKVVVG